MPFWTTAAAVLLIATGTVVGSAASQARAGGAPQAPGNGAFQAPAPTPPPPAVDGEAVFTRSCATCHAAGNTAKAPTPDVLRQLTPEAVLNALVNGKMTQQGSTLSDPERRAVAALVTGKAFTPATVNADVGKCTATKPMSDPAKSPAWSGWGAAITNARYVPGGGLTAADLPKLKLKWAFGYHDVAAARGQPAVAGGRVFAANENSEVRALDMKTGCSYWTYKAQAGIRAALSVGPYKTRTANGYAVYFGDAKANVYAVDANTGKEIWIKKVDEHPSAAITGAPTLYDGRLYVPLQGLNEEGQGGRGGYACCTFRGSVTALDASTGAVIWKTYTVEPNKPRGVNKDGAQLFGPAGGGIWSSPTIDPKRRMVYVATGNGYAEPVQKTTDAVLALDINTGVIKWVRQVTVGDSWTGGCPPKNDGTQPQCPETLGPDFDFSASPVLVNVGGKDRLVLPQKSGMAYALDPDNEGAVVWQTRIGQGSGFGGQWGASSDGTIAYIGVADMQSPTPGGLKALRMADGSIAWAAPPQPTLCRGGRGCSAAQGSATTLIPGAVLSGSIDGGLRAYNTANGDVIWTFDTNKEFPTVNGVKATGASLEGAGPVVAGGMLFINSGYGGLAGRPGNVLLAFGLD
jgi:polyvinyl alcohol dehydrogenase (cytochrome)